MLKKFFKKKAYKYIDLPIYSIATFKNLIIFSGGGGHGISNQILLFEQKSMKQINKVQTKGDIIENMVVNSHLSLLACSANEDILIYLIKNNNLQFLYRFRCDFLLKNSTLNSVQWRQGYPILASGGDDKIVRVHELRIKERSQAQIFQLLEHSQSIKHIDMHKDSTIMVSNDNFKLYVSNYQTKNLLGIFDSSVLRPTGSQLQSGYFLNNNQLILVSYQPRGDTFVSKFNTKTGHIRTKKVIHNQSCLTAKSSNLDYIAIASGNGTVQVISTSKLQKYGTSCNHDMVIKGIDFIGNSKVVSGTPECSYHVQKVEEELSYMYWVVLLLLLAGLFFNTLVGEGEL